MDYPFLNDLTIIYNDGELEVISFIWVRKSAVFKSMLENKMLENRTRKVELKQYNKNIIKQFIL